MTWTLRPGWLLADLTTNKNLGQAQDVLADWLSLDCRSPRSGIGEKCHKQSGEWPQNTTSNWGIGTKLPQATWGVAHGTCGRRGSEARVPSPRQSCRKLIQLLQFCLIARPLDLTCLIHSCNCQPSPANAIKPEQEKHREGGFDVAK